MKKLFKTTKSFFKGIWNFIDKNIIFPITKLIHVSTSKFDTSGKTVEGFLSKTHTILYISLFLAISVFIIVDQKILVFSESSAEVLKSQPINALYNEEAYVVEGLPQTVDITLIGSKADLYFAKQSPSQDITVDLSDLKPGTHKVTIKYNQAIPSIDYKVNPSVATIIIYQKLSTTKTLAIDLLNQDSLDAKLVINNVSVDNDKVVVKGAEYQLAKVATVKALIDIKNLVSQEIGTNTLKDVPLKAYDDQGNVVEVEIVPSKLDAVIEIASPSKELPIRVIPTGELSFGQAISTIVTNVNNITVYGDEAALADLKYIPVKIDVSGLKENHQYKQEIIKPTGVNSMSVSNVTVNVTLGSSIDRELDNIIIDYRNLGDNLKPQGTAESSTKVSVILKGVASVVNQITPADISAYLDLKGYGVGTYDVDVQVSGTDVRVKYIPKTLKVTITITK